MDDFRRRRREDRAKVSCKLFLDQSKGTIFSGITRCNAGRVLCAIRMLSSTVCSRPLVLANRYVLIVIIAILLLLPWLMMLRLRKLLRGRCRIQPLSFVTVAGYNSDLVRVVTG